MRLWLDLETFSATPIRDGTYKYAENAEILVSAFAVDDGPVEVHEGAGPLAALLPAADEIWAHNSMFDRSVLRANGIEVPVEKWRDTMVQAYSHSLPGALDSLCDVLRVPVDKAKDKEGRQLVMLFCKPRPATSKLQRATRATHPAEWAKFLEYARLDVEAMRECHKRMPAWNYPGNSAELSLWHLDQRINDFGVAADLDLARAAVSAVAEEQVSLGEQTQEMTGGVLDSATRRDKLLEYIFEAHGIPLPDLQKATIERRLNDPDVPDALKDLLRVRLQASTTSTSKYKALSKAANSDGRVRGLLQFAGAGRTGRWSGRVFQPQNLPRPTLKQHAIDQGIALLKAGSLSLAATNVMQVVSSAIRGALVPAAGKKFVVADLANIEGRVLAWLANERWKLRAFEQYDTLLLAQGGTVDMRSLRELWLIGGDVALSLNEKSEPQREGFDLYNLAYAKSFDVHPSAVTKDQRQVGKVQELAFGYEGGVGACVTFGELYNLDLDDMARKVLAAAPSALIADAEGFYAWTTKRNRTTFGLAPETFIGCDVLKRAWREAHQSVSSFWPLVNEAFKAALANPGQAQLAGPVVMRRDGAWVRIKLPSGRYLCYPAASLDDKGTATYMGMNQYSRKWSRLNTYGGKLVENITQAVARDVLAANLAAIEAAGYRVVLTVHDEVITEAPDSYEFNENHLAALMTDVPQWAEGLPLAAAGFQAYRYRKD